MEDGSGSLLSMRFCKSSNRGRYHKLTLSLFPDAWSAGPVLRRFDQFLLIGPCAEGGPALALSQLTNTNLQLVPKLIVNISGTGPSVFQGVLRNQNGS